MKKTILGILTVISMAVSSYGQGTIVFANGTGSIVYYNGPPATAADGVKAQLWYAPVGTTDLNLFEALPTLVSVGVPLPGRFSGGTMTIPGVTPAGGSVAAIVRVFTGPDWANRIAWGHSGIFTIDTGDPTTTPAGTPTSIASLIGSIGTPIPEPSSMALAGIGVATTLFFRRRK